MDQTSARLGNSFSEAVEFARVRHAGQMRKGTNVPYLSHLLAVASLPIEGAATDPRLCDCLGEIAVAALLHDLVEDTETVVAEIAVNFGDEVERIVVACSDRDSGEEEAWKVRKARYLVHLQDADDAVLCVSLADKRHNARCIVRDLRAVGVDGEVGSFWQRFNAGPDQQVGSVPGPCRGILPAPTRRWKKRISGHGRRDRWPRVGG